MRSADARIKSVQVLWRRRSEYTRWKGWIDHGVGFTSYHFHTLHLTIERFPRTSDDAARQGSETTEGGRSDG